MSRVGASVSNSIGDCVLFIVQTGWVISHDRICRRQIDAEFGQNFVRIDVPYVVERSLRRRGLCWLGILMHKT